MMKVYTALASASLLALAACGGSEEANTTNATDELVVPTDELGTDNGLGETDLNGLGNDLNATGDLNAVDTTDLNATDANVSADANATGNNL